VFVRCLTTPHAPEVRSHRHTQWSARFRFQPSRRTPSPGFGPTTRHDHPTRTPHHNIIPSNEALRPGGCLRGCRGHNQISARPPPRISRSIPAQSPWRQHHKIRESVSHKNKGPSQKNPYPLQRVAHGPSRRRPTNNWSRASLVGQRGITRTPRTISGPASSPRSQGP